MTRRRRKRENAQTPDSARSIPRGAIPADQSKQSANNSYFPPEYYEDIPFTCRDCGAEEVWTAEQQQWFYEVAKGSIYATAVRCRACRNRVAAEKKRQRQQMEDADQRRQSVELINALAGPAQLHRPG